MNSEVTVELEYGDGFREGFLQGFMASYAVNGSCDHDDCPRGE